MATYDIVKHLRGLEKDLPIIDDGRIAILEDANNKRLVIGTVDGNVILPSSKDFTDLSNNLANNTIGDTSTLKTINKILVPAINEIYELGGNGSSSTGGTPTGVNCLQYTFTATFDNTTSFTIQNTSYDSTADFLQLFWKGSLLFPNKDYTTNGLIVTLNFSINTSDNIYYIIYKVNEMIGSKIIDGTVTKAKLETSVQNSITSASKIGDLTTLNTTSKDTIVNSINEVNTASNILTKLKTVDGTGSGLDADTVDGKDSSSFVLTTANNLVPSGAVMPFAMVTPPSGWFECNGQAISRTTFANLYNAIGITYGNGDGSTTFNVPDIRGYFVRGYDDGRGIDSGRTFGSTQNDTVGSHDTEVLIHATSKEASGYGLTQTASFPDRVMVTSSTGQGITANYTGTETRPKNIALMYCIKY
jgi:microcystin-dependent protein